MVNINSDLCETSCCVGWPIAIDSISIEQEKYRNECDEDTGCTAVNCQLRENINDYLVEDFQVIDYKCHEAIKMELIA